MCVLSVNLYLITFNDINDKINYVFVNCISNLKGMGLGG